MEDRSRRGVRSYLLTLPVSLLASMCVCVCVCVCEERAKEGRPKAVTNIPNRIRQLQRAEDVT